ncbi:MAG: helix-turn-helix transcriptional regulator [Flexilinea sp.]|nr:helix-turn-helix transcriptional regulator [Flexilinea sp.]
MKINLKEKRIEQKLTQQQLAKAIGSGQSSVSRFESGKLRPKPEIAQRLGKVLDFDWKEIYEEEEADDA